VSWKDSYRMASFRGVAFHAREVEGVYGRRQIINSYPKVPVPYVEDMGRKYREFALEGYVIGDDYDQQLLALIAACEDEDTPGRLVNPYRRGDLSVRCAELRTRETTEEGGIARFMLSFYEAGELKYPAVTTDPVTAVKGKSDGLIDATKKSFGKKWNVIDQVGFVRDAAIAKVEEFTQFMDDLSSPVSNTFDDVAFFAFSIAELRTDIVDLVNHPAELATRIGELLGLVSEQFVRSEEVYSDLIEHYEPLEEYPYPTTTKSRQQQAANDDGFNSLVRQMSTGYRATVIADTDYPTYDDAYRARETTAEQLDVEAENTTDDDVYTAVAALRAETIRNVPPLDKQLPRLRPVQYTSSLPSLVVAYRVYADSTRAEEIVARNKVRHPGFMPGGRPIQVVSDG
jgi:prophage DNA circulation protein